jgi:cytochrome c oxidase subunit 4
MSTSHDSHSDPTQYDGLGHHIASLQTYIAVFGSLLFFTALTYAVSFADLGPFALLIAMMVAGVKAFLVATFFMHLKYDEKFNVLVFISSLFFIAVFFGFTLMDLGSRAVITETEDYHTWWAENPDARPTAFGPAPTVESAEAAESAHVEPAADGSHDAAHAEPTTDGSHAAPHDAANAPAAAPSEASAAVPAVVPSAPADGSAVVPAAVEPSAAPAAVAPGAPAEASAAGAPAAH